MNKDTKFASRENCELTHKEIRDEFKEVHSKLDHVVGWIDGQNDQKKHDITFYGMLLAMAMGFWNIMKSIV